MTEFLVVRFIPDAMASEVEDAVFLALSVNTQPHVHGIPCK